LHRLAQKHLCWHSITKYLEMAQGHISLSLNPAVLVVSGACEPNNLGGSAKAGIGAELSIYGHIRIFKTKVLVLENLFSTKHIIWL
jgi:hypothetical protein